MLAFNDHARIYIKPGHTDMRKSINTLLPLVEREMQLDPADGAYFVFCGKSRRLLKILYWDKSGYALWLKKLEKARFPWPPSKAGARALSMQEIQWLLQGIDFFAAHEELKFSVNY
jgi:transposase